MKHGDDMKHDDDDCCGGPFPGMLVRLIFVLVVVSILFSIVFGIVRGFVSGGSMMVFYSPFDWLWGIVGILFFIWVLSWIFRWPMHGGHWGEASNRISKPSVETDRLPDNHRKK